MESITNQIHDTFPAECEVATYRELYDDLKPFSDEDLFQHFLKHGIEEGRITNRIKTRVEFLKLIPANADILEIGPFYNPIVRGEKVKYFDVLNYEELIARATALGHPTDTVPFIHFADPKGDLDIVTEQFDAIVSSHNIEHQPDLIGHLQKVERLLRPGGYYFCIIPDKRYCFDHFMPETTIADIYTRHRDELKVHYLKSVIEHIALVTHNFPTQHWRGEHGEKYKELGDRLNDAVGLFDRSNGEYLDVHAHHFTPGTFSEIIGCLKDLKFTNLSIVRNYHTRFEDFEFFVIMQKD